MFLDRAIHRACGLAVLAIQHLLNISRPGASRSDIYDLPPELLDDITIPEKARNMLQRDKALRRRSDHNHF